MTANQEVVTLDTASAMLTKLTADLAAAATLPELDTVQRRLDAFQAVMKRARFGLLWQNQFAVQRFVSLGQMGGLFDAMDKNKGGRPTETPPGQGGVSDAAPQTYKEMGFTYNFASECQRIFKMPREDFDAYCAKGLVADDQAETWKDGHSVTLELTKRGLLDFGARVAKERNAAEYKKKQEQEARERGEADAAAVEQATTGPGAPGPGSQGNAGRGNAGSGNAGQQQRKKTEPPETPEIIPPLDGKKKKQVKAALRTALDPTANQHEAANAIAAIQKIDPRLTSLDDNDTPAWDAFDNAYILNERLRKKSWEFYETIQRLEPQVEKYEARDRDRLAAIRGLKAEIQRLQAEIETLKGGTQGDADTLIEAVASPQAAQAGFRPTATANPTATAEQMVASDPQAAEALMYALIRTLNRGEKKTPGLQMIVDLDDGRIEAEARRAKQKEVA